VASDRVTQENYLSDYPSMPVRIKLWMQRHISFYPLSAHCLDVFHAYNENIKHCLKTFQKEAEPLWVEW